jgi:protease-4
MILYEFLKSILLAVILISITPFAITHIKTQYSSFFEPHTYIGILSIKESVTDSSAYIKHLHSFFKDTQIKGIILKINCYDCAAGTSQTIFNEIQQGKKIYPKPVIALIENICIAGAYLIASASDYIIAPESAIIGGIGFYTIPPQLSDYTTFFAVNYPLKKHLHEHQNQNDSLHNETYQQFIKYVATARRLSLSTSNNWAQGKIFTGKQASNLGLVNTIGSMHTVITLLKEKALIDGEIEWIEKDIKSHHFQSALLQLLYNVALTANLS